MYVGRIVAAGMTPSGKNCALYRVSSRSFPNREAKIKGGSVMIVPKPGHEKDIFENPYISYNCVRPAGDFIVVSNGSHTDPAAEKIAAGTPPRDALALTLSAMDYEKDSLDTPRIIAVTHLSKPVCWLGIVRKDAVIVREFKTSPGVLHYAAVYEKNNPSEEQRDNSLGADSPEDLCHYILKAGVFADFEKPVTAAAALADGGVFRLAVKDQV
jgi:IMP cyclohydrolase